MAQRVPCTLFRKSWHPESQWQSGYYMVFFWHFFWFFFDNPSGTACVTLPVLKVWYSDYYIDFFWLTIFLWHFFFFEKNKWHRVWHTVCWKSLNLESCCDDGTMTYVGTKQRQGGDHMTTRLRRHDDDTVATWRHGHEHSYIAGKAAYYRHHADVLITS